MTAEEVPDDHPRHGSLVTRHRIEEGVEKGITSKQGLVAQGRGEALDYLLGEETVPAAERAERTAVARTLLADHAVVSVNGNVAALCPQEAVSLAEAVGADIEVNIFHRTRERLEAIAEHLREHGADEADVALRGLEADARIPDLSSERAKVDRDGIYSADVVVVPLEDGDRAEALDAMGKDEIVVDLNPLSRSAQTATVPVVDNVVRAFPRMTEYAETLASASDDELREIVDSFDADEALHDAERRIREGFGDGDTR
ncbi:4-phosphopantoate--beta-alanine ligase [Haladaptatus sp. F3-133]|uniref:4-phosphopantoate--beta-alanine ligase n=1 Tax=Halorutilus salinus TaxID=2487751 RepID=A0A9Q4GGL7_9EURY|nr:4-phosphopantoate--beta-alanine ligase [Halorutilus salinus]MCX2817880.1 4-phosphopantoate--beta-alanine ligase [Halorutilus salinus]